MLGDPPVSKLLNLLAQRHANDVFVPECKIGESWGMGQLRVLDAWAMRKSWRHPAMFGYEIKVSRQDFLRDDKWHEYLPTCNHFYFVCPFNLIQLEELPPGVGLLYATKTGSRLYTKRKAPRREIETPVDLWQYILQSRARIDVERSDLDGAAYWEEWLALKKEKRVLAHRVGEAIREHVRMVEAENTKLRKQQQGCQEVRDWFQEQGLRFDSYMPRFELEQQRRQLAEKVPPRLIHALANAVRELRNVQKNLGLLGLEQEEEDA